LVHFFGFSNSFSKYLTILADTRNLRLQNRTISKKELGVKQLISYIILKNKKGDVLSYRRASSEKSESLLKGTLAIGFGGHVNEKDLDLFDMSNAGVNTCAHRELFEEIKGLRIDKLTMIGVINDDSSPLGYNKIAFIFEGILSEDFNCNTYAKEMAINQIKFLKVSELWDSFHDMEFWSQLILKCHICNKRQRIPTLVKSKRRPFLSAPLIVVGEIGAGKTEVTNFFKNKFQGTIISIRECICEVMGIIDFGNDNRVEFQRQSQELISKGSGVRQLIHNVTEKIKNAPDGPIVIDGVRNLKTYNLLKKALPKNFCNICRCSKRCSF
jgi:predicted NUDIX family phosphoesterase